LPLNCCTCDSPQVTRLRVRPPDSPNNNRKDYILFMLKKGRCWLYQEFQQLNPLLRLDFLEHEELKAVTVKEEWFNQERTELAD
ncbi:hypothetical protein M8C21_019496, partial [Ambrosia artemisiifolia]